MHHTVGSLIVTALLLSGCPSQKSAPATSAPPSAPAAPSAVPLPSARATGACDVTILPGDRIGDKTLAGTTSVRLDVEPGKTYCVFGLKLTAQSTMGDVLGAAPPECSQLPMLGGTHLNCDALGVALSFGGPPLIFSRITVYPKDTASPAASSPSHRTEIAEGAACRPGTQEVKDVAIRLDTSTVSFSRSRGGGCPTRPVYTLLYSKADPSTLRVCFDPEADRCEMEIVDEQVTFDLQRALRAAGATKAIVGK